MRTTRWIFWLFLCIATITFFPAAPTHAAPLALSIPVQPRAGDVQTDGEFVVWTDLDSPQYDAARHLYAAALGDGQRMLVASNVLGSDERGPNVALSNGVVIWQEQHATGRSLRAKNLRTGQTLTVATGEIAYPAIAGSTVTWWEDYYVRDIETARKPATLKARDLATMSAPITVTQTAKTTYGFGPSKMSGTWIAYAKATGAAKVLACWQLEAVPITGGTPYVIADLGCAPPKFDLIEGRLTYIDRDGLLIANTLLGGGQQQSGPHGALSLSSDLRYSFWGKYRQISQSQYTYDLWGYDSSTESAFLVAPGTMLGGSNQYVPIPQPHTRGDIITWIAGETDGSVRLRAARIVDMLPNARRESAGDGQIWFPEVGHTLGGSFRAFWERSGGLPIFGFPLTEEFIEKSRDTGQGYPVQYLERQRFEYHAEHAGTAYEVLLGRLGAEQLQWLGRDWQREPKASLQTPHYYAATGHAIAPQFWDYWRTHGLELGDRGISEREALALFGYPLTEPQMETNSSGDRVLTQWFERARFEYHPNNPAGSRVLLGRLS
ncbi:MAG TPA: hypothetical protein VGD58_28115, partial [Herpetosiphonaceae bacterium]